MFKFASFAVAVSLLGSVLMMGCSGSNLSNLEGQIRELNKTNIAKVRSLYELYKDKNGMRAPKNKAELIGFLRSKPKFEKYLSRLDIEADQLESYFISERDGEEFQIKWGLNGMVAAPFVFEKNGVDGMRFGCGAELVELNQSEFDQQWKAKAKAVKMDAAEAPAG